MNQAHKINSARQVLNFPQITPPVCRGGRILRRSCQRRCPQAGEEAIAVSITGIKAAALFGKSRA